MARLSTDRAGHPSPRGVLSGIRGALSLHIGHVLVELCQEVQEDLAPGFRFGCIWEDQLHDIPDIRGFPQLHLYPAVVISSARY